MEIAVIGAGAVGRAHASLLRRPSEATRLGAIVDPDPAARDFAASLGAPWFADAPALLRACRPDGAIVAAPNDAHAPLTLELIEHGVPTLVEKPIAQNLAEAEAIAAASERSGVAVLVGHQRRYNPVIETTRAVVASGRLGRLVTVAGLAIFRKDDAYFDAAWRREPASGGPILINLIHEIDLVRHVCGEFASVHAFSATAARGFDVEDTAAVILRLVNGALATLTLSDAAPSPWSWDVSARENAAYPPLPARAVSHILCGTEASLTLPHLEIWRHAGPRGWREPLQVEAAGFAPADPYATQIAHFARVIRGEDAPRVGARDAAATLRATLAVRDSARTGATVELS
jgi:predicted dehydrogenase